MAGVQSHNNTTDLDDYINVTEASGVAYEYHDVSRMIIITTFPVIMLFGTIGNLLTFVVMQRGSLKHSSTCFYMAILALADTGK